MADVHDGACKSPSTLIHQLSEQHPSSLLLNFAIQQISESGLYTNEIAAVSTAASSFRVFHRVLHDALDRLAELDEQTLSSDPQAQQHVADFKKMCCNTQYTYLYSQAVLTALIVGSYAPVSRRRGHTGECLCAWAKNSATCLARGQMQRNAHSQGQISSSRIQLSAQRTAVTRGGLYSDQGTGSKVTRGFLGSAAHVSHRGTRPLQVMS